MSETYSVVMTGNIAEGMALEQVKANVAKLFKLGDQQLEKLFSGKPVAVRRGIDRQQADKICAALKKAGAIAAVKSSRPLAAVKTDAPASKPTQAPDSAQPPRQQSAPAAKPVSVDRDTPAELDCPRCGHHQPFATACSLCKMDLTLHLKRLKRREQIRANRQRASR